MIAATKYEPNYSRHVSSASWAHLDVLRWAYRAKGRRFGIAVALAGAALLFPSGLILSTLSIAGDAGYLVLWIGTAGLVLSLSAMVGGALVSNIAQLAADRGRPRQLEYSTRRLLRLLRNFGINAIAGAAAGALFAPITATALPNTESPDWLMTMSGGMFFGAGTIFAWWWRETSPRAQKRRLSRTERPQRS